MPVPLAEAALKPSPSKGLRNEVTRRERARRLDQPARKVTVKLWPPALLGSPM